MSANSSTYTRVILTLFWFAWVKKFRVGRALAISFEIILAMDIYAFQNLADLTTDTQISELR